MAEFSKLVITNKGQALIAKMMAGSGNVDFTKVCTSSTTYREDQLQALTALGDIKQTSLISKITRTNNVAVQIETAFTNTELKAGYYMKAIGLYARDPDDGEILYAVTAETSGNCYMPAYNGVTVSGAFIQLVTTVGNADSVSLSVNPGAVATIGDIQELQAEIADLQALIGFTDPDIYGVEVDFANKTFTRLAGAVNKTPGENFNDVHCFGGRRRCNVTDEGKVIAYQGDDGFSTTGKLTKAITMKLEIVNEGQNQGYKMRKARYYLSPEPKTGFKLFPAFVDKEHNTINDFIYLSAFEGSLWDVDSGDGGAYIMDDAQSADFNADMLCSIAGAKPASGLTQDLKRANVRKLAHNRGNGWNNTDGANDNNSWNCPMPPLLPLPNSLC